MRYIEKCEDYNFVWREKKLTIVFFVVDRCKDITVTYLHHKWFAFTFGLVDVSLVFWVWFGFVCFFLVN